MGADRLGAADFEVWERFRNQQEPKWVHWALRSLQECRIPLAVQAEAIRSAGTDHVKSIHAYAVYLQIKANHEASRLRPCPRRGKAGRTSDDDQPRLDL
jgi:hypothetical protein